MTAKEFGCKLREARKKAGISQLELSLICDMSSKHIGSIERGKLAPTIETISRLAHGLDITVAQLVDDTKPELPYSESVYKLIAYGSTLTPEETEKAIHLLKVLYQEFKS